MFFIENGAVGVELWSNEASHRILVPMSYISWSDIVDIDRNLYKVICIGSLAGGTRWP